MPYRTPATDRPVALRNAVAAAAAACLIAGCDTGARTPPAEQTGDAPAVGAATGEAEAAFDPTPLSLDMEPVDDSGVRGTARVEPDGDVVRITVALRSSRAGVHRGYVYGGRCDSHDRRTPALERLEPIVGDAAGAGEALSTVELPARELLDGRHIIVYHAPGGSPGVPVACAQIPARS
jgi:hypothetical protein